MGDWRTENLENHSGKDIMIIKRDEGVKTVLYYTYMYSGVTQSYSGLIW